MEDTLKNLFYQGLGVIALTRDKVEKTLNELVDKGKLTREEGKKLFEEFSADAHKAGMEFKENSKETIREWIEKSGIPSREEFDALKARVEALEKEKSVNEQA
jgi:polyhydroxyalkanoate synthesis regulator phasin